MNKRIEFRKTWHCQRENEIWFQLSRNRFTKILFASIWVKLEILPKMKHFDLRPNRNSSSLQKATRAWNKWNGKLRTNQSVCSILFYKKAQISTTVLLTCILFHLCSQKFYFICARSRYNQWEYDISFLVLMLIVFETWQNAHVFFH